MTNRDKLIELGVLAEVEAEVIRQGIEIFKEPKSVTEKFLINCYENNTSLSGMLVFAYSDKGNTYWWDIMRKMEEIK